VHITIGGRMKGGGEDYWRWLDGGIFGGGWVEGLGIIGGD